MSMLQMLHVPMVIAPISSVVVIGVSHSGIVVALEDICKINKNVILVEFR